MGYTHYWDITGEVSLEKWRGALPAIRDIIARHRKLLAWERDKPDREPEVGQDQIRFNGIEGCETFFVRLQPGWNSCKTDGCAYEQAVCEVLLVLAHDIPQIKVGSDGFYGDGSLDKAAGTWPAAAKEVAERYSRRLWIHGGNLARDNCAMELDRLFAAMERHGDAEGTEAQLGDAEGLLRVAYGLLTPAQLERFLGSRESVALFDGNPEPDGYSEETTE
jgi:hypothetical protein